MIRLTQTIIVCSNETDRYVNAFFGRVPGSVLTRRYSDFSPERLRETYKQADLRVLN